MHARLLSVLITNLILLSVAASSARQTTPLVQATEKSAATTPIVVPFEIANRHIMLKVKVNNSAPLSFVLDTGDKYAIINIERAKELDLQLSGTVRVGGAGASTSTGAHVREATFTIPGVPGFSQPVNLALPLNGLAARLGQDFDGIIGSEFISQFVVEIDYQAKQLKLHDKEKFVYAGRGEAIPIKINSHGHPILEAEVTPRGGEPVKGKFVLDIGAGGALSLHSPFVTERGLLKSGMKTIKVIGAAGAGGEIAGRIGRVAELKIGQYKIAEPITLFSQDTAGAFANPALLGNIGAQVARKFRVFLDYGRSRIILEPNSNFGEAFDRSYSGVALQAEGKNYRTFRVTGVLENSPASELGLQRDDVITAIDGKPATEFNLTKLNEMFEKPVSYNVTVQRGEQVLNVKLTPRKLI